MDDQKEEEGLHEDEGRRYPALYKEVPISDGMGMIMASIDRRTKNALLCVMNDSCEWEMQNVKIIYQCRNLVVVSSILRPQPSIPSRPHRSSPFLLTQPEPSR